MEGLNGYSDTDESHLLLKNIELNGILDRIAVNDKNQILSGKRRWLAAIRLANIPSSKRQFETIEVEVANIPDDGMQSYAISSLIKFYLHR